MINNLKVFAAFLGLFILAEITIGTLLRVSISTIERRFQLSSTTTALITSCGQIGTLLVLPFVSFAGSRYHRPRVIAMGSVILMFGLCLAVLPHFLAGPYEISKMPSAASNGTGNQTNAIVLEKLVCRNESLLDGGEEKCSESKEGENTSSSESNYHIWMMIGLFLGGVGGAAVSPLGVSYIDDHCEEHDSALYIGIMQSVALVGPVCGYLLGSFLLRIWVDFLTTDVATLGITPKDPLWVGAWWLGVSIGIVLIFFSAIPFWFFPRTMNRKGSKKNTVEESQVTKIESHGDISFRELWKATMRLLTNKHYLLVVLLWNSKAFEISGSITFKTKYIEVAFGTSAAKSSFLIGAITSPFLIVGTVLGSIIIKVFKLQFRGIIRLVSTSRIIVGIVYIFLIYTGCQPTQTAGIDIPYSSSGLDTILSGTSLNATCNAGCACPEMTYAPVCGEDDVTYVTPCHAGCSVVGSGMGKGQNFTDCSCVGGSGRATGGRCPVSEVCEPQLWKILGLLAFCYLVGGLAATSSYMLLLRSIDPKDKAYALGTAILFLRIFGWIPAPIVFGKFIDKACALWTHKPCSDREYCSVYHIDEVRTYYFTLLFVCAFVSFLLSITVACVGPNSSRDAKGDADAATAEGAKMLTDGAEKLDEKPLETCI